MLKQENYYIWIIGCQYNEWDGARIKFALDNAGYKESDADSADLIIILACAVRQTAVNRIYGKLNQWKGKKVVISGCVLDSDKNNFLSRGVNIVSWDHIYRIADLINIKDKESFKKLLQRGNTNSAYIPIMTGCNNFCAYCAVPYTRGREISRNFEDVVNELKEVVDNGMKNIMLLGQNVNSYKPADKKSTKDKSVFTMLLEKLNNIDGNFEISFTSNHPKDMTKDIVCAVSKLPKIKKEIHLPVQSGSDKILKAMNRPYTIKKYLDVVKMIRQVDPEIKLTTDVIVGFPGETKYDFNKTVEVFKKVGYKQAYINKYSPRKGTAAFVLGDPIPWKEKQRRWHRLNKLITR